MLIQADARHIPLHEQSVHCVVTSPPYWGLRDYGIAGQLGLEATPEEYVATLVTVFREVRRVLRDDGTVWLNLGDSYAANRSYQVRDNKHVDVGNTMASSVPPGLKPKDLIGIPWRVAFALQADGWWLRSDIIWAKPNPMPESVTDRPTKAHEYIFLLSKSERYYYDAEAVKEPATSPLNSRLPAPRGSEPYAVASGVGRTPQLFTRKNDGSRNRRTVWTLATQPYKGAHFATFPEKLIEPCVKAGCPVGGFVLDPFVGSGTTLAVAQALGRHGVGLELKWDYLKLAQERVARGARLVAA